MVSDSPGFSKLDFDKTGADYGLFVSADKTILVAVYIGDLLLFGADIDRRFDDVMQNLRELFRITNLSGGSYYLGMEVEIDLNRKTITSDGRLTSRKSPDDTV